MSATDWMLGIAHDPGSNAGYRAGRSRMDAMVLHYTAGAYGGDYAVGTRGYFNFYCPRERDAVQFAEGDALTWHAGEWNDQGPGIEMERRDDSVAYTDHQLEDLGRIAHWLHDRYGIPLDRFYDTGGDNGARLPESSTGGLCITHRSLAQLGGWHSDYLTREEWERAIGGATPEPEPEDDDMQAQIYGPASANVWITDGIFRRQLRNEDERAALGTMGLIKGDPLPVNQWFLDALIDVTETDARE